MCENSIGTKTNTRKKRRNFFCVLFCFLLHRRNSFHSLDVYFEFAVTATLHFTHSLFLYFDLLLFSIWFLNYVFVFHFIFFCQMKNKIKNRFFSGDIFHRCRIFHADRFNCHIKYVIKAIKCERNHMRVCVWWWSMRKYGIR